MPERPIGVTDEPSAAGVADYRLRERSVSGSTVGEQYVIPQRERVASFRGMCGDWWAGNSASQEVKCAMSNLAGSAVMVSLRSLVCHMVPLSLVNTAPVPVTMWMQNSTATAGTVLTKVSAGLGDDAAQTSDASVEIRSRHTADNSSTTPVTLTVGSMIRRYFARPHTLASQMISTRGLYPTTDYNQDSGDDALAELVLGRPLLIRPGWSVAVTTASSGGNTQLAVSWLWDEYTLP